MTVGQSSHRFNTIKSRILSLSSWTLISGVPFYMYHLYVNVLNVYSPEDLVPTPFCSGCFFSQFFLDKIN